MTGVVIIKVPGGQKPRGLHHYYADVGRISPHFNSVSAATYVRYLERGEQQLDHMTDTVQAGW